MKRLFAIIAMCIGIFLCMLDTTVMNIALPAIQDSLKVNLNDLQWSLNVYTIIFASLTIPLSKLAEKFGKHKFYLLGLLTFMGGSLISALSSDLNFLIFGRGIQSIGAAIVFPLSMTIGINTVSLNTRKSVIAALGVTQGLAAALGPTIGGVLTQFLGWRWIFLINLPLMVISFIICLVCLDLQERKEKTKIDYLGALISMATLFSLTLGLVQGRDWGWTSFNILTLLISSAVLLILFILWEKGCQDPMVPLNLFKNKEFMGSAIAIILSNVFLVAVTVVLPTYFTRVQSKTELEAALLVTPITAMIFIFSPLAAFIIDKLGPRLVIASGFTLMAAAYILFTKIDMADSTQTTLTCLILGTGYGIIAGPITVLAASDFTGNLLTASQSVAGVLRQVGIVLAVAVYVTGLYTNLGTAKKEAISYIKTEVKTIDVSKEKQQTIQKTAIHSLGQSTSHQTVSNHFSKTERKGIINEAYQKTLQKYPSKLPQVQKQEIYKKVKASVEKKLATINKQINKAIKHIKDYSRKRYTKAFTKLYSYSIIFIILAIFSSLLFPRKNTIISM
ncbi:DHA2 family efflux MFS transporter permease subunit [Streptococcus mutans]|uniref:DHA2 family efflux MFS transporter permease subunit n=1 Tax=Streptococcus mutans TaxID=1309 RepID=UPI0001B05784|nr:DHA2 family efflux MFS transporter permease subunit [Streptococcus mutans]EMB73841.1 putative MDR permease [Streptococcus mutans 2VS1]EMC07464.1 putative MDR permease [Streptococcus mutans NLML4]EMC39983.1 putative MDR permease [Streptococcus mutans B]EMP64871.1 MDR permease [Streptococcus mutans AC4446]MCB4945333.1 MFS transporter [Streptococcus mutans]